MSPGEPAAGAAGRHRAHLFSPPGTAALGELTREATLYAFDFDGTLAPIVPRPGDATLPPALAPAWAVLCAQAPVAVISGRGLADLATRLPTRPAWLIGNHGAEGLPDSARALPRHSAICDRWAKQLGGQLPPGAGLEHKGATLTLHYRHTADPPAARRVLQSTLLRLDPPAEIVEAKCAINLLPPGAPTKDRALAALVALAGCRRALYVGDDDTDEWVFRHAAPSCLTVCVGEQATAAAYFLHGPAEVGELLDRLIAALAACRDG